MIFFLDWNNIFINLLFCLAEARGCDDKRSIKEMISYFQPDWTPAQPLSSPGSSLGGGGAEGLNGGRGVMVGFETNILSNKHVQGVDS